MKECFTSQRLFLKDFRPSDMFDNPYLTISWLHNSEHCVHWCQGPDSGLGTLLYLHGRCPYITHYCFFCQEFYNNFTKMSAVSIYL